MRRLPARFAEWLISAPSLGWLLVLFVAPTVMIFVIMFRPANLYGGIGAGWTLQTIREMSNPNYPAIIWRTVWLSVVTTAVCLLLAPPCGYCIARSSRRMRQVLMLLVIVPFWTSFLIRVFAWKVLLHPEGPMKHFLVTLGLIPEDSLLLYNQYSVLLVMIYTYLPFAILPIYAAAEKFDFSLMEAARDLGAGSLEAFYKIFLPGISRGVITAVLMVLIPSLGSYVIPDIMGGPTSEMIGNKIAQRVFSDRNLPQASALTAFLALSVIVPMVLVLTLGRERGRRPSAPRGKG